MPRARRWGASVSALVLFLQAEAAGASPTLLKDIDRSGLGSNPSFFTEVGGVLLFDATEVTGGLELWRTDGTTAGTVRLADINPGPASSEPSPLTKLNGIAFFSATDSDAGRELWKTDSTSAGTTRVADIHPGPASSRPENLVALGDRLFFTADQPDAGRELWTTDGTAAGTQALTDLPGYAHPAALSTAGDRLFFTVCVKNYPGCDLWTSDGTTAGTFRLSDLDVELMPLGDVGGRLFFAACDDGDHTLCDLWASDGTDTERLADIDLAFFSPIEVGARLFVAACEAYGDCQLWTSDGTAGGTHHVVDFDPSDDPDDDDWNPPVLAPLGGSVFFAAIDALGEGLWKSDGTLEGTERIASIENYAPNQSNAFDFTAAGDLVFFHARDEESGGELWRSDGTAAGTFRVADLLPGPLGSAPASFQEQNGRLLFTAADPVGQRSLWTSDGTAEGTKTLADLRLGLYNRAVAFGELGGKLLLGAWDPEAGLELWRTDGTAAGTARVADINTATEGTSFGDRVALGSTLFFVASDPESGLELWRSDGTAAGTLRVTDLNPGPGDANPTDLLAVEGVLFFVAFDPSSRHEVWRSDGTPAGTVRLTDLDLDDTDWPLGTVPIALSAVNGGIAFSACETSGCRLWLSDGTPSGTVPVATLPDESSLIDVSPTHVFLTAYEPSGTYGLWTVDITSGVAMRVMAFDPGPFGGAYPRAFTLIDRTLFFAAFGPGGEELWKSDGTMAGTVRVQDIFPGAVGSKPSNFRVLNNRLLFTAEGPAGQALWRSDGTESGTAQVALLEGSFFSQFTIVDETLFYLALGPDISNAIWRSEGTAETTVPVARFAGYPSVFSMADGGGRLVFAATDAETGSELWTSDGTPAGTVRVADLNPGPAGSGPSRFISAGRTLFFTAHEPVHGLELWGLPVEPAHIAPLGGNPSTTTTTTAPSPTTTSIPRDDGPGPDVDRCDRLVGTQAIRCLFDELTRRSAACDPGVPRRISRRLGHAQALVEKISGATPRRARRLTKRAIGELRVALKALAQARKRGTSPACVDALVEGIAAARGGAEQWLHAMTRPGIASAQASASRHYPQEIPDLRY